MRAELSRTICEIKVQGVTGTLSDDKLLTVVPQGSLEYVITQSMKLDCWCCERCDYKKCELFKAIQALYHYDFLKTETCPLADMTYIPEEMRN